MSYYLIETNIFLDVLDTKVLQVFPNKAKAIKKCCKKERERVAAKENFNRYIVTTTDSFLKTTGCTYIPLNEIIFQASNGAATITITI